MIARDNERDGVISVLVAESCAMNCELMATALERDGSGLTVVASATDTNDVLSSYFSASPDVCIVGANLKDGVSSGFKATQELRSQSPEARVILLLDMEQSQAVVNAFRVGAAGIFSREEPFEVLFRCIQRVHEGQLWLSNRQVQYLVDSLKDFPSPITDARSTQLLTKREQGLDDTFAEGRTNKEIYPLLSITEHTSPNYIIQS